MTRYAVYYAPPPESDLHRFGSAWLGRDAWTGATNAPAQHDGLTPERATAITAAPRMYGFHATLKPPFALAPHRTVDEVESAFAAFARDTAAFEMPALRLAEIAGFLALVPRAASFELTQLAERAVREFDAFRAPPSADERERRAQAPLDARERELLERWGYPYVLDRWRFHMTLTGRLESDERARVRKLLEPLVEPHCAAPVRVDAVALFEQPGRDRPFVYRSRYAFERRAA